MTLKRVIPRESRFIGTTVGISMHKKFLLMTFFLISQSLNLWAGSKDFAGTSAAQFLKIGVGARPVAMGEAFGAVSDDSNAIYWNPAGLGQLTQKEVGLTNTTWLEKSNLNFIAYCHPIRKLQSTFAIGLNQLSIPAIDKYDNQGRKKDTYNASNMAINLAYGGRITDNVFAGTNIKSIQSSIDSTGGSAIGLDFGFLYNKDNVAFAAAVQNIGSKMTLYQVESSLPMNIKIGTALTFPVRTADRLLVAFDINAPSDDDIRLNIGTEYVKKFKDKFSIAGRFGVKTNTRGLDSLSAISLGFGIKSSMLNIDLVMVPYGDLGSTMRISFGVKFGSPTTKPKPVKTERKETMTTPAEPEKKESKAKESEEETKKKFFLEGQEAFKNKDYKNARILFEKVLEIDPLHSESANYINRIDKLTK